MAPVTDFIKFIAGLSLSLLSMLFVAAFIGWLLIASGWSVFAIIVSAIIAVVVLAALQYVAYFIFGPE